MNPDNAPERDESADYVLVRRNSKNRGKTHHYVSPDADVPPCEIGTAHPDPDKWFQAQADDRDTELCGHCAGSERDRDNPGSSIRRKLLDADADALGADVLAGGAD